jgi:hypothetical protein
MVKRAEINAVARTQTNDTRCFSTREGHGKRAKRQGAKRLRQHLQAALKRDTDGINRIETDREGAD